MYMQAQTYANSVVYMNYGADIGMKLTDFSSDWNMIVCTFSITDI